MRRELNTARLRLRPLCSGDEPWLAALLMDPEVMRFIPRGQRSPEQAFEEAHDVVFVDGFSPHMGFWAIEDDTGGEPHGWAALKKLNLDDIEVGYRLRRSSWGRGIATEAAGRLLHYGFGNLELDRIVGVTIMGNLASDHVLEKIGLRFEKSYSRDGLVWRYFAVTKQEWERPG